MNILNALKQLRDDIKIWVTNNLNALNAKIDEKTIPIDSELNSESTNPVQNRAIAQEISSINDRVGDTPVATQISQAINAQEHFSGDYNDLTNAPDIFEDGSGNMIIADESGNIIFKADADGMHTTAVSINGEAAATEKYVDEAVANIPTPDVSGQINAHNASEGAHADIRQAIEDAKEELSESIVAESDEWKVVDEAGNIIFSVDASGAHTTELTLNGDTAATESYVDDAIANIEFPTTDLTDYATKKYVDDAVGGIEIPDVDFTGYATETYVDNKVADLVNSAPEALNTLGELATALENHEDAYDALLETVGGKATHADLKNLKTEISESIVSETDEFHIVDNAGNIVASIDENGVATTTVTAQSVIVNGDNVEEHIDDTNIHVTAVEKEAWNNKVDKVDGKGLSTNDFTDAYKEAIDGLSDLGGGDMLKATYDTDDDGVVDNAKNLDGHAANYFATADHTHEEYLTELPSHTHEEYLTELPEHSHALVDLTDDAEHRTVTDTEKQSWNAKSDFSGDYNDLANAPNITEDGAGDLVIADPNGNIVFRSNGSGFETTTLTAQTIIINGADLEELIAARVQAYIDQAILGGEW